MKNRKILSAKVVLVGDSGVGKSSIILRQIANTWNNMTNPTMGAVFLAKMIEQKGIPIKFQIWDTAGQEKFHSLTPLYQKAIIVYDVTNKKSFEGLQHWVQEMKEKGPKDIIFAIVANKIDLLEGNQLDTTTVQVQAESLNATFKCTSAKENKGIEELFYELAEKIFNQPKPNHTDKQGQISLNNPIHMTRFSAPPKPPGCDC